MIGLDYKQYSLLFSYDINISELRSASNFKGGIEVSVQKTFQLPDKRDPCKAFRFR